MHNHLNERLGLFIWSNKKTLIGVLAATLLICPFNGNTEERKSNQPSVEILHYKPNSPGAEQLGDLYISDTVAWLSKYKGKMLLERGPTISIPSGYKTSSRSNIETIFKVINWEQYAEINPRGPCYPFGPVRWLTIEPTTLPQSEQIRLNITGLDLRLYSIEDLRDYTGEKGRCIRGSYSRRLAPP